MLDIYKFGRERYPFVATYHPILKNIGTIIRKNLHLLYI